MSRQFTRDFLIEVAKGNIAKHRLFTIPGRKDSVSTTVLDDITQVPGTTVLGNPGTFTGSGGVGLEIVSSSTNDDGNPVGSGVRTVDIHYLDETGAEQEETVTMDGQTVVTTTATDIAAIQWIHAKTVGAGGVAAGNISLQGLSGGTVWEYVLAGGNQSLSGRYHIPVGHTAIIIDWSISALNQKIDLRLRATCDRFTRTLTPGVFLFQDAMVLLSSILTERCVVAKVPALATVKISGISFTAAGDAGVSFRILIIED